MSEKFGPDKRVRKRSEFLKIKKEGACAAGKYLRVWRLWDDEGGGSRLGVIVGKRVARAASARSLWKRRLREVFRRSQQESQGRAAILVQPRIAAESPSYGTLKTEYRQLGRKLGFIKREE
ncbi:MAG: ribonuclease P protein component [Candidatus Omnitrophota bacterium]